MTALNRAFPFAKMNNLAVLVAQHLKLDMPRIFDETLGINIGSAESLLRLAARSLVSGQKLFLLAHHAHAAAAAAGNRLQNQRVADIRGFLGKLFFAFDCPVAARDGRQSRASDLAP